MDVNALPQQWQQSCKLTSDELDMYLRPDMLSHNREGTLPHGGKRSKIDVFKYRVRALQDNVGCWAMRISFLKKHSKPVDCMALFCWTIRFLAIPEMLACMGLIRKLWIAGDISEICHVIGNAIAVPRAVTTLLNMISFIRDDLDRTAIQENFKHFLDIRLNADNIAILTHQWGWSIIRSDDAVPPTIPIHAFLPCRHQV